MFNDTKKTEMVTGFSEAAEDDDKAFYLDLRNAIKDHTLADDTSQAYSALNSQVSFTFNISSR